MTDKSDALERLLQALRTLRNRLQGLTGEYRLEQALTDAEELGRELARAKDVLSNYQKLHDIFSTNRPNLAKYVGWNLGDAAVDYITKLEARVEKLKSERDPALP